MRVLIVDDNGIVRRTLTMFLDLMYRIEIVGEASNGQQAIHLCEQLQPDVILMDLFMPQMDGIEAIQSIHAQYPAIRIVVLTSADDPELFQRALQAGAAFCLHKDASLEDIAKAISSPDAKT